LLSEPELIGFARDLEQELNVRRQPQFLGSIIPGAERWNLRGTAEETSRLQRQGAFAARTHLLRSEPDWR